MLKIKYDRPAPENLFLAGDAQIFDLLELSRRENEVRIRCLGVLRRIQALRRSLHKKNVVLSLDHFREQRFLRAHLREIFCGYRQLRQAREKAFDYYIKKLPQHIR